MKLLFTVVAIFLLVRDSQSDRTATANLHADCSLVPFGTLLFHQKDANSPVRVVGILDGLKRNTVHVCFVPKERLTKKFSFQGFHVHADPLMNGELNCTAAGPHFNPYSKLK